MTFVEMRAQHEREHEALRARHVEEERALLRAALEGAAWGLSSAARALGIPVSTLQSTIERRHPELDAERRAH
jgi:transcriptional regulator with GAF, ATPase, and Fis domain